MLYEFASSRAQALRIGTLGTMPVSLQADRKVKQVPYRSIPTKLPGRRQQSLLRGVRTMAPARIFRQRERKAQSPHSVPSTTSRARQGKAGKDLEDIIQPQSQPSQHPECYFRENLSEIPASLSQLEPQTGHQAVQPRVDNTEDRALHAEEF
ncbi:hypothetical protein B9Z19DRAFT_1109916 [Tuber borchii]|uniref:Uncharacterized protein n=1 Tax=Tuber borchii TaxID=42251 RepID=A0A2T6ZJQ1_TUBBO|nr:hypothetical protein B9Z19DRAFT_1109916 [Tuber borchii]